MIKAENACSVTTEKVGNNRRKDTWWWNEEVKLMITKKKDTFNRWRKFDLDQYKNKDIY